MNRPSRRELLALSASGVAVSLSGCLDSFAEYLGADVEGELVVALTNLRRPTATDSSTGTPADIAARVDVENRRSEAMTGRLEMELRYVPDGETEQRWRKTDQLEVQSSVSPQLQYIFEAVYQPGSTVPDEYELDAEILDTAVDSR